MRPADPDVLDLELTAVRGWVFGVSHLGSGEYTILCGKKGAFA